MRKYLVCVFFVFPLDHSYLRLVLRQSQSQVCNHFSSFITDLRVKVVALLLSDARCTTPQLTMPILPFAEET